MTLMGSILASARIAMRASGATTSALQWSGVLISIRSARTSVRVLTSFSVIVLTHRMTRAGPIAIFETEWEITSLIQLYFAMTAQTLGMGNTTCAPVYRAMVFVM